MPYLHKFPKNCENTDGEYISYLQAPFKTMLLCEAEGNCRAGSSDIQKQFSNLISTPYKMHIHTHPYFRESRILDTMNYLSYSDYDLDNTFSAEV